MPKVTVITLCYNHARFLPARIASVLNQTFQDFEWIIIDDASQDGSQAILQDLRGHTNVKGLILHSQNIGCYPSYNEALALAEGEYIYRAEGDDVCEPGLLEVEVSILNKYPNVDLVHTCCKVIDDEGQFIKYFLDEPLAHDAAESDYPVQISPGLESWARMVVRHFIASPSVMFRKKCYDELGGFLPHLVRGADWEYWLRIMLHYDVAYVPLPLASWRYHGDNWSGSRSYQRSAKVLTEYYRVQEAAFARAPSGLGRQHELRRTATRHTTYWVLSNLQSAAVNGDYGLTFRTLPYVLGHDPGIVYDRRFIQFVLALAPGGQRLRALWQTARSFTSQ